MRRVRWIVFQAAFVVSPALALSAAAADHSTELATLAKEMDVGEWRELKTKGYGKELLTSGRSGILSYSESAAWDHKTQSLHFVGQGHLSPPPMRRDLPPAKITPIVIQAPRSTAVSYLILS